MIMFIKESSSPPNQGIGLTHETADMGCDFRLTYYGCALFKQLFAWVERASSHGVLGPFGPDAA